MTVLVTGANGFLGRAVIKQLIKREHAVRCAVRSASANCYNDTVDVITIGDVNLKTNWDKALQGVDSIIHLVARTHVTHKEGADPLPLYRRVNVDGTRSLAQQAVAAGVRRLVFVSSIKVNGERTSYKPYTELDEPAPEDAYGITKNEAENILINTLYGTDTEYVIVRPPLLYGVGVKANMHSLLRAVLKGLPLPLASVLNKRSLLGVNNLADFLLCCLDHPNAAQKKFLIADDESVSTPELVCLLANAAGVPSRLLPCPISVLRLFGKITGRASMIDKLVGSLQVDSSFARRELEWQQPFSMREGLQQMVDSVTQAKMYTEG